MKPLTSIEMATIIAQVKADLEAETPAQKFYKAVRAALEDQLNNGMSITDPRIDDVLKAFIANQASVIGRSKW